MPGVGVERHALGRDGSPITGGMAAQRLGQGRAGPAAGSAARQHHPADLDPGRRTDVARRCDHLAQLASTGRVLLGNDAAVEPERHPVRHDVGVDAAVDQPDGQRAARRCRGVRRRAARRGAPCVERGEDRRRRLQRVDARYPASRRGPSGRSRRPRDAGSRCGR